MKTKIQYILIALVVSAVWGCEADGTEGLPSFDNSLPLYVQLNSPSSISAEEGDEVAITIELPEVVYADVIVQYELVGDLVGSGSVTIPEGSLNADAMVSIPDDEQMTGGGTATFTLTSVDNGLSLGRQNATTSIISTTLEWTDNDN